MDNYYNHKEIEKKWQETWEKEKTYLVKNQYNLPKYYVLDMFPYPNTLDFVKIIRFQLVCNHRKEVSLLFPWREFVRP